MCVGWGGRDRGEVIQFDFMSKRFFNTHSAKPWTHKDTEALFLATRRKLQADTSILSCN